MTEDQIFESSTRSQLIARIRKLRGAVDALLREVTHAMADDPFGTLEREREGFVRVSVTAVQRLEEALK